MTDHPFEDIEVGGIVKWARAVLAGSRAPETTGDSDE